MIISFCNTIIADDIHESQVPQNVKNYIIKYYPNANNVEWESKIKKGYYKAEFKIDGREIEVEIYTNGELKELDEDLYIKDIPSFAIEHINKNYTNPVILGGKKKIEGSVTKYNVGFKYDNSNGKSRHLNIDFDSKGNVLRRR